MKGDTTYRKIVSLTPECQRIWPSNELTTRYLCKTCNYNNKMKQANLYSIILRTNNWQLIPARTLRLRLDVMSNVVCLYLFRCFGILLERRLFGGFGRLGSSQLDLTKGTPKFPLPTRRKRGHYTVGFLLPWSYSVRKPNS